MFFLKPELYTEFAVLVFFTFSLKDFFLFSFALVCFFKPELYTALAVLVFFSFSLMDFFLFSFALVCFLKPEQYLFASHSV